MKIWLLFLSLIVVARSEDGESNFSYDPEDDNGPYGWANLEFDDGSANECAGDQQSPIALVKSSSCDDRVSYTFASSSSDDSGACDAALSISKTGLQGDFSDNCQQLHTLEMPDGTVQATRFKLHVASEHTIDEASFDAEIHIIHRDDIRCLDGTDTVIVALMLEASSKTDNEAFGNMLSGWLNIARTTLVNCGLDDDNGQLEEQSYNIYDLIPSRSTFLRYSGSLTTPPCSETVDWHVVEKPVAISTSQLALVQTLVSQYYDDENCELSTASYDGSIARSIQSLNDRTVERICPNRSKIAMLGLFLVGSLVALFLVAVVFSCAGKGSPFSQAGSGSLLEKSKEKTNRK